MDNSSSANHTDEDSDYFEDDDEIIREEIEEKPLPKKSAPQSKPQQKDLSKPKQNSKPKEKKGGVEKVSNPSPAINSNENSEKVFKKGEIVEEKMGEVKPSENGENSDSAAEYDNGEDIDEEEEFYDDDGIVREYIDGKENDEEDEEEILDVYCNLNRDKVNKTEIVLREYQYEIFNNSVDKNGILYLETGAGKTVIAMMLVNYYLLKKPGKKVIFLSLID